MKIALVASSYLPHPGEMERRVDELARGLTRRGAQVEVLTQEPRGLPRSDDSGGFVVRRFVATMSNTRFAVAPGLWEHLRRTAASFDILHAHGAHAALDLAVARAGPRRLVFTPHAPVQRMLRWPYARITQALVVQAAQTICSSSVEGELMSGRFPWAANRISVVPDGVDVDAIQSAAPFVFRRSVVLTVGPLERDKRVDRAIAAIASLDPALSLVVIGDGPSRHKLLAHAADLAVSSRVQFIGAVPDRQLYRWLRTARVLVVLAEHDTSGLQVIEALSAGTPVVASDIPIHREAASHFDGAGVTFVSLEGSPFEVADAITEAAGTRVQSSTPPTFPSWDAVVDNTLALYEDVIRGRRRALGAPGLGVSEPRAPGHEGGSDVTVAS